MAVSKKRTSATVNVAPEGLGAGRQKDGSFLPHTASNGGWWVRN